MNNQPQLTIGLFGFGVVGKAFYDLINQSPGLATIKTICIKDSQKERGEDINQFTVYKDDILEDEEINTVVELIDDAEAAFNIVKRALQKGKAVVSANKKMIAENFQELLFLQKHYRVPLLYEASCCGGVPVIRSLEGYFTYDEVKSLRGIINGSTNFVLSQMLEKGLHFSAALAKAQQLGFAEANPALDIEGHDAANKLSILLTHAFGCSFSPGEILYSGINNISVQDTAYAVEHNCKIKLVALAKKSSDGSAAAFVLPHFVNPQDELYHVHQEVNALEIEGQNLGKQILKGKGAGAYPTASAVLNDIALLLQNYQYPYSKLLDIESKPGYNYLIEVYVSADELYKINTSDFESIHEVYNDIGFNRVIGTIYAQQLINDDWWKKNGVSLIVKSIPEEDKYLHKDNHISKNKLAETCM